jgi:hypothetical protein
MAAYLQTAEGNRAARPVEEIKKPKNWRPSQSGGCRTIIREDHRV